MSLNRSTTATLLTAVLFTATVIAANNEFAMPNSHSSGGDRLSHASTIKSSLSDDNGVRTGQNNSNRNSQYNERQHTDSTWSLFQRQLESLAEQLVPEEWRPYFQSFSGLLDDAQPQDDNKQNKQLGWPKPFLGREPNKLLSDLEQQFKDMPRLLKSLDDKNIIPGEAQKDWLESLEKLRQQFGNLDPALPLQRQPFIVPFFSEDALVPQLHDRPLPPMKGRLGILIGRIPDAVYNHVDLPSNIGLFVVDVVPNSPAANAGIKKHDILTKFNDKDISNDEREFVTEVAKIRPGEQIQIEVLRKGQKHQVTVMLPEAPKAIDQRKQKLIENLEFPKDAIGTISQKKILIRDNAFEMTSTSGQVSYQIKGRLEDGRAVAESIQITNDGMTSEYQSLEEVPEDHRAAIQELLQSLGGSSR